MKKFLIIISLCIIPFILILFTNFSPLHDSRTDLEKYNLTENVRGLSITEYDAVENFGNIKAGKRLHELETDPDKHIDFNKKGNLKRYFDFVDDLHCRYSYDDNNQLSTKNCNKYTLKYQYEKNIFLKNILTKELHYDNDGSLIWYIEYDYDFWGNVSKESHFHPNGMSGVVYVYEYDYNRNKIRSKILGSNDQYGRKYFKYDAYNNIVFTGGNKFKYFSDKSGNWIKKHKYEPNLLRALSITERNIEYK